MKILLFVLLESVICPFAGISRWRMWGTWIEAAGDEVRYSHLSRAIADPEHDDLFTTTHSLVSYSFKVFNKVSCRVT